VSPLLLAAECRAHGCYRLEAMRTALASRHHAARMLAILAVLLVPLLPAGQAPPGAAGPPGQLAAGAPFGADQVVFRERDRSPVPRILPTRPGEHGQVGRALGGKAALAVAALAVLAAGPGVRVRTAARRPRRARPAVPAAPRAPPLLQLA
jgi:hypothetical protein